MKKTFLSLFGLVLAFSALFVSCSEQEMVYYNVSLTATEGGSATFSDYLGSSMVVYGGSEVTAVAAPNEGYAFVGWFIGLSETPVTTTLSYTTVINKNLSLVAKFVKDGSDVETNQGEPTLICNISLSPSCLFEAMSVGGVAMFENTSTSHLAVYAGKEVTAVAVAAEGYVFVGWFAGESEDPVSTDAVYTFDAQSDLSLIAKFAELQSISVSCEKGGIASFNNSEEKTLQLLPGEEVTVVATPNEGREFVGWFNGNSETPISVDNIYTFTVSESVSLTAKFTSIVSINCTEGGNVYFKEQSGSSISVSPGTDVTIIAIPNEGYYFDGWFVDGCNTAISTDATYTIPVVEDIALTAKYIDNIPIRFDIGAGQAAATRGKGAVGDVDGTNNIWNGEELKVYMFDKGTLDLALDATYDNAPLFDNAPIIATAGANIVEPAIPKYYPMQGNFDFFAYHVDDAATGEVAKNADAFTLPVTIDGSQDLMVAKAKLTADQAYLLPAAKADDYYSAFSARQGVNPHFKFQHLLTRLTFEVKAADADAENILIESIEITNANTTADMVVAYTTAPTRFLKNQATPATVSLQGIDAEGRKLSKYNFERIGESLLLMPQYEYNMVIRMTLTVNGVEYICEYTSTLNLEQFGLTAFEAGKQYNVKVTVYDFYVIKIELQYEHWEEGGDLEFDIT